MDREKVSYGLRCMCYGDVECKECPYAKDSSGWHDCRSNCAKDALAILKSQEAVVRCKDCKYWKERHTYMSRYGGGQTMPRCEKLGKSTKADWFCADWEAKE